MVFSLLAIMVVLLLFGFPMIMTMLFSTLYYMLTFMPDVKIFTVVQQMVLGVQSPVLMAIPMFMLAADIMCTGHTSNRLLDFVERFVGHLPGGMATTDFGDLRIVRIHQRLHPGHGRGGGPSGPEETVGTGIQ